MPSYVVKADPEQDWYVYWSTVVDGPVDVPGGRGEYARRYGEDRVARADAAGTSMNDPDWTDGQRFGWNDDTMMTGAAGPTGGQGWIFRKDLRAFVEAMMRDDKAGMLAVHHSFDDLD